MFVKPALSNIFFISWEGGNSEIELDFTQSPFYKSEISEGQMCLVSVGLQIKAAKFSSLNPLKLAFEKQIAYHTGDVAIILKPESPQL